MEIALFVMKGYIYRFVVTIATGFFAVTIIFHLIIIVKTSTNITKSLFQRVSLQKAKTENYRYGNNL